MASFVMRHLVAVLAVVRHRVVVSLRRSVRMMSAARPPGVSHRATTRASAAMSRAIRPAFRPVSRARFPHHAVIRPRRDQPMPVAILGCCAGSSHRMIDTSVEESMATHPAVGLPTLTCRKNALPAPGTTGLRFTSITTA